MASRIARTNSANFFITIECQTDDVRVLVLLGQGKIRFDRLRCFNTCLDDPVNLAVFHEWSSTAGQCSPRASASSSTSAVSGRGPRISIV